MALDRNRAIQVSAAAKETAYDTAQTVDERILIETGAIPQELVQVIDDSDLIGGNEEAGDQEVFAQSGRFDFNIPRVKPAPLAIFGAYALGSISTAAADTTTPATVVKQHAITPQDNDGSCNSMTIENWKTDSVKTKMSGGLVNTLGLSVSRGANRFVSMAVGMILSGTTASAGAAQTEQSETQLSAASAGAWLSTTATAGTVNTASNRSQDLDPATSGLAGSPVDVTAALRSMDWQYTNGISEEDNYRIGGGNVLSANDRQGRSQTCTIAIDYTDDTYITAFKDQTQYAFQMIVRGPVSTSDSGYYHGFNLIFPIIKFANVEIQEQGGRLVNMITFSILQDPSGTLKSVYLDVFNEIAAIMA